MTARVLFLLAVLFTFSYATTSQAADEAPNHGAAEFLDINEFRVVGNTTLPARTIETAVYPHLGPHRTFDDVEAARLALETAYHEAGFATVFVDIPEQKVEDGIVRLHATEGRLNRVHLAGARYFSGRQLRAELPATTAGEVPSIPALQAELATANAKSPDRQVVPVLKAGPLPGTVDLDLNVEDHVPFHGSVELNNQYSADTKPLRLALSVDYANLFDRFDDLSAQYQSSPQERKQVGVFAIAYARHLAGGDRLTFSFIRSTSQVAAVGSLGVIGAGRIAGVHYDHTLFAAPGQLQSLSFGADYKRFDQTVNAGLGVTIPTPLAYGLASATYAGTVLGEHRNWTWSTSADLVVRGSGSSPGAFDDKCFNCRQNQFIWRGEGAVVQQLGHGFTMTLRGAGQLAVDPIVSNEQFLLGGAQSVRGYYEAEELGDVGYRGTLELHAPSLFGERPVKLRPFLFGDHGRIRFQAPLDHQVDAVRIGSIGAGLDFDWTHYFSGNITWARALDAATRTRPDAARWLFEIRSTW